MQRILQAHQIVVVVLHNPAMDAKSTVHVVNRDIFYSPNCARSFILLDAEEDKDLCNALRNGELTMENLQHP